MDKAEKMMGEMTLAITIHLQYNLYTAKYGFSNIKYGNNREGKKETRSTFVKARKLFELQ